MGAKRRKMAWQIRIADDRAWWLTYGARAESRQQLGGDTRNALTAGMQEAAGQYQPWAVVPCLDLGLHCEACDLLFSGTWSAGALEADGVFAVLSDYQAALDKAREYPAAVANNRLAPHLVEASPALELVHGTLALSAHVLTMREYADQLAAQLIGRHCNGFLRRHHGSP
jgi:hypothetical protein